MRFSSLIVGQLEGEEERWLLWLPVCLGAGISLYFALPVEPPIWLGGLCCAVFGLACLFWRQRSVTLLIFLALAGASAGFMVAQLRTAWVNAPMLTDRVGPVTVTGQVVLVEPMVDGHRLTLENPWVSRLEPHRTPHRLRIRLRGEQPQIAPGNWVEGRVILLPPAPPVAPGAFDFQRHAYFQGLGANGFSLGKVRVTYAGAAQGNGRGFNLAIAEARHALGAHIQSVRDGPSGAVLVALLTGARGAIPELVMEAIRGAGLAHLLAISGLHLGLVSGTLFFALRAVLALVPAIALRIDTKKTAAAVALIGGFVYALLAGATVPTQRAFLMLAFILLAVLMDREGITLRLVAVAATIILIFQPEALLTASFQMSFAAVTTLVALFEHHKARSLTRGGSPMGRLWAYVVGVGLVTVVASVATAPFTIFHFNQVAVYGVVANLLSVPVFSLWVMPWGVVSFLLLPVGGADIAYQMMVMGIDFILAIAHWAASFEGALRGFPAAPIWGLVLVALGGIWLCIWRRPWRWAGLAGVGAFALSFFVTPPPDLWIDAEGRVFALRDAENRLSFSTPHGSGIVRETWLRRSGGMETTRWPKPATGRVSLPVADDPDRAIACDALGCVVTTNQERVAILFDPMALIEDCRQATVLITTVALTMDCPAPSLIIDGTALRDYGAHALWFTNQGVRVSRVADERGERPWNRQPHRRGY
ncbi:MAG: ComEC/Rec2 family competence protein [Magnetospiraceae bacterium]